jgi:serine/threonine protein kinase/WD40 repeat protein
MLSGELDESRLEPVLEHVDQCTKCRERIEHVQTKDPLAEQLADLQGRQLQPTDTPSSDGSSGSKVAKIIDLPAEIGPYRLDRTIAVGGMGTVYEARHRRLGRPFAVKLLHYGTRMSRVEAERVRREWRNHGRLVHPNIVGATDAGISHGQPYLVTERIDGIDLSKLVRQRGPLRPADACEIIRQAADGLQYAHDQQVIHGDVKPSNLMLSRRGVVKLLDLGTARRLDEARFRSGRSSTTHGTLAYMAPEQLSKRTTGPNDSPATDHRADIYSLGCTLYCLLTGGPPFAGAGDTSNQKLIEAHRLTIPDPLLDVIGKQTEIDPRLQQIVDRMLAKDPADRFESMQRLIEQIAPLCTGHDITSLLEGLEVESAHLAEPNLSIFDLTQGLTRLLKTRNQRPRWIVPTVAAVLLTGLAAVFALTRERSLAVVANPANAAALNVAASTAPLPIVDPDSVTYMAKTSWGTDLWHQEGPIWARSERQGSLDGLVLQPAKLSGVENWQMETTAPRGRVRCLRWSANGNQIATVSTDGHVRLFDWRNNKLSLSQIVAHRDHRFVSVDFHRSRPQLFACTADKLLRIDAATGTIGQQIDATGAFDMEWVNRHNLISVSSSQGITLYDPDSLELAARLPANCQKTVWSRDGDRVAYTIGNAVSVRRFSNGQFAPNAISARSLDQTPHNIEFTPSLNQLAIIYPYRIEMLARGRFDTSFSLASKGRLESITFGDSDDKMLLGSTDGIQRLKSAKMLRKSHRHQIWGRSKVAWNPKQDCIAIGQDGVLRVVDDQMRTIDAVGANKAICDVTMPASDRYGFLFRSGKLVYTNGDGRILGWSTFLPEGNRTVDQFVPTAMPDHLAVKLMPSTTEPMEVPIAIPSPAKKDSQAITSTRESVRHLYKREKFSVERWNRQNKEWRPLFESKHFIKTATLSPNEKRLAILSNQQHLTVLDITSGQSIVDRNLDDVPLQNGGLWLDDRSLLIAGASNMRARNMARFDVAMNKFSWIVQERHDCTAAEVAILDNDTFLQAGAVHNVRSTLDGQIQRSIKAEQGLGRRHGRVYRAPSSQRFFTWGYDFAAAYESNASDGVVSWDTDDLTPRWILVDVGEEETLTLSPAGQVISATPNATENLVWLVDDGSGIQLKTWDEFQELQHHADRTEGK